MDYVDHENLKEDSYALGRNLLAQCLPYLGGKHEATIAINALRIALQSCYLVLQNNKTIDMIYLLNLGQKEMEGMYNEEVDKN